MEELMYKLLYLTKRTTDSFEELFFARLNSEKFSLDVEDKMRILYGNIMNEKMIFNSLKLREINTLIDLFNEHPELDDVSNRCLKILYERKTFFSNSTFSSKNGYAIHQYIDMVLIRQAQLLIKERIDSYPEVDDKSKKFKEELLVEYLYHMYTCPERSSCHEMQGIFYGFEDIPKYDFNWLFKNTELTLVDIQDYLLEEIVELFSFFDSLPSEIAGDEVQYLYDTFDTIMIVSRIEIIMEQLDDEHLREIYEYYLHHRINMNSINEDVKMILKRNTPKK